MVVYVYAHWEIWDGCETAWMVGSLEWLTLLLHCLPPHTCQSLVPVQLTRGAMAATKDNHLEVDYMYYHCYALDVFLTQLFFI